MDPVNFQCGHCGQLMAVAADHLGQQVRCPHCQQVVVAPTQTPPVEIQVQTPEPSSAPQLGSVVSATTDPPSEVAFNIPPPSDPESIFSEKVSTGEDLFGADEAHVEMPPEPAMPRLELDDPSRPQPIDEKIETPPHSGNNFPRNSPSGAASGSGSHWQPLGPSAPSTDVPSGLLSSVLQGPIVRVPEKKARMLPLLIVPLISYSILITIAAGWLWFRLQNQPHPLEALPDQGENQGATHNRKSGSLDKMPTPDKDLPSRLRVPLGKSLKIGDLEVTPANVERRKIQFRQEGGAADPTGQETLALTLQLRNVSEDLYFKPLDPYFERRWKLSKPVGLMPYSFLTLGDKRFFGGPVDLFREPRILVVGQDYSKELGPGDELSTFVCTDPEDKAPVVLDKLKDKGPFLWRVQVRRGLVKVREREVSATAVVGVEFYRADVH